MERHSLEPERVPPPGERRYLFLGARRVVLFTLAGTLHAIDDSCPHQGASLFGGKLSGKVLRCPAHGLRFELDGGGQQDGGLCLTRYRIDQSGDEVAIWA